MMATAFTGYVLPWGQMSFWGSYCNFQYVYRFTFSQTVVNWFLGGGGYTVNNLTLPLNLQYSLCFTFSYDCSDFPSFNIITQSWVWRCTRVWRSSCRYSVLSFFFDKDAQAVAVYLIVFGTYVLFSPNVLNHPGNYIPANDYETSAYVVPEWYFLAFYSLLRSIPYKTLGVKYYGMLYFSLIFYTHFTYYAPWRNTEFRPVF